MSGPPEYEVAVVGAGPAGLTTAMYTTRLGHATALIDRTGGRHTTVDSVHNVIGVSEETSGQQITALALAQLEEYGADYYADFATSVNRADGNRRFRLETRDGDVSTDRVVLATGFTDDPPPVDELRRYTGHGLHYCLHCDAYTLVDEPVYVFGHTESAATVAMIMLNFTDDVDLLLDGEEPVWGEEIDRQLRAHPIEIRDQPVRTVYPADEDAETPWIGGITFDDGTSREYVGGFAMYGSTYNTTLATDVGCDLTAEGAVRTDEHGRTSVDGVYAVGDVTHGHNQTPIAMGDGAKAGIAVHKDLRTFPLSIDEIEPGGPPDESTVPAIPDDLRARAHEARETDEHSGMAPDED